MRFPSSLILSATMAMALQTAIPPLGWCQEVAVVDPSKADADFAIQGEYVGDVEIDGAPTRVGVQVIAKGGGKLAGVAYKGGLPGDGWDGNEFRKGEGTTVKGIEFPGDADVLIHDGVMTVNNPSGTKIGQLKKITRKSATLGEKPPQGAIVLFNGTSADQFLGGKLDGDLLVQGVKSHQKFQSFSLHLEFLLSYMPTKSGQERSNSGCYCQGRYEVQILDSFGLSGESKECGGIYGVKKPDVNMCFPPLTWQTYDIDFTAAKFDGDGKKIAEAKVTVKHNGTVIHKDVSIPMTTTSAPFPEGPEAGPLYLQDHRNPVRFRNIWIVEKN